MRKTIFLVLCTLILTKGLAQTYGTVTDIDGNVYKTITVERVDTIQVAYIQPPYDLYDFIIADSITIILEDLRVKHFSNGDSIPAAVKNEKWTEAWIYNKPDYSSFFDKKYSPNAILLYNYYAVSDPRGLCPKGWHVPSEKEWKFIIANINPSTFVAKSVPGLNRSPGQTDSYFTYGGNGFYFWTGDINFNLTQQVVTFPQNKNSTFEYIASSGFPCRCMKSK